MPPSLVRDATAADIPSMAAIYDEQVLTAITTFDIEPLGMSVLTRLVEGAASPILVVEDEGRVLGYAYAGSFRPRPAYRATREVSIYLDAAARGRGIGRDLYSALLARLDSDPDVHTVLAVVALPNDASERLHRGLGFERAALLREVGHKLGRWIDVAMYQRTSPS
ncbi:GNAT family N-acetyltransferase [Pseudactinotalea suaedae]|uniref:GNAT family N-acetyltransferase n=1 Tax=Pseudactinotalea suaedae TaxID=1524924 RepID=UPI0019D5ADF6|nr:GNAT family N-acetyltransferase [Pseudactinotalea suaedae]